MNWTWKDLANALVDLLETLGRSGSAGSQSALATAQGFFENEARVRPVIDRAIRQFATTREWPALSPGETRFLELRVNYGLSILVALDQGSPLHQPPADLRSQDAVRWLLIDAWARGGATCMHRQLALLAEWSLPSGMSRN